MRSWPAGAVALILAAATVWGAAIIDTPFYTKGEPREALVVEHIVSTGDWVTPVRNGDEIPSKPPLFHWAAALSSLALPVGREASTRLPSLLAALLATAATMAWAARGLGGSAALATGAVLLTVQQWVGAAVVARVDMTLALAVTLAVLAAAGSGERRPQAGHAFFAAAAAAVLAKGPVGLALPVAVVGLWSVLGQRTLPRVAPWSSLLWLVLPLAWYVAAGLHFGEPFVDKLLMKENVMRVLDPDSVSAGHVRPFWYYIPLLAGGFAPWSLVFPFVGIDLWRGRRELEPTTRLALVWLALVLVVFSAAGSKRAVYLIVAYPAVAVLVGRWWVRTVAGAADIAPRALAAMLIIVAAIAALPALLLAGAAMGAPTIAPLAAVLSETDAANLGAIGVAAADHRGLLLATTVGLLAVLRVLVRSAVTRRWGQALPALAAAVALMSLIAGGVVLPRMAKLRSYREFFERIVDVVTAPDAALSFYRTFDYGAVFYRGRPITTVDVLDPAEDLSGTLLLVLSTNLPDLETEVRQLPGASIRIDELARSHAGEHTKTGPLVLVRLIREASDERARGDDTAGEAGSRAAGGL